MEQDFNKAEDSEKDNKAEDSEKDNKAEDSEKDNKAYDKAEDLFKKANLEKNNKAYDKAEDLFIKAAYCFKELTLYRGAAACYIDAAESNLQLDLKNAAACNYINAAKCLKLVLDGHSLFSYDKNILLSMIHDVINKAIKLFKEEDNLIMAAKYQYYLKTLFP